MVDLVGPSARRPGTGLHQVSETRELQEGGRAGICTGHPTRDMQTRLDDWGSGRRRESEELWISRGFSVLVGIRGGPGGRTRQYRLRPSTELPVLS